MKGIMKAWQKIKAHREYESEEEYPDMMKSPKIIITSHGKIHVYAYESPYKNAIRFSVSHDVTDMLEMELGSDRNKWTYKKFKACCEWILNCIKEDERWQKSQH